MKVVVDWDLCEANAVCMKVCPEVFELQPEALDGAPVAALLER